MLGHFHFNQGGNINQHIDCYTCAFYTNFLTCTMIFIDQHDLLSVTRQGLLLFY